MKIVYNACYGGFGVSQEALKWMAERGHEYASTELAQKYAAGYEIDRADPLLVQAIETLGSEVCSGSCAELAIEEIPDGAKWEIDEYDGFESVVPPRQVW